MPDKDMITTNASPEPAEALPLRNRRRMIAWIACAPAALLLAACDDDFDRKRRRRRRR